MEIFQKAFVDFKKLVNWMLFHYTMVTVVVLFI